MKIISVLAICANPRCGKPFTSIGYVYSLPVCCSPPCANMRKALNMVAKRHQVGWVGSRSNIALGHEARRKKGGR